MAQDLGGDDKKRPVSAVKELRDPSPKCGIQATGWCCVYHQITVLWRLWGFIMWLSRLTLNYTCKHGQSPVYCPEFRLKSFCHILGTIRNGKIYLGPTKCTLYIRTL